MLTGIGPEGSNDTAILTSPTWSVDASFKAKSYNLQHPANETVISTVSSALATDTAAWVQLSAFGVRSSAAQTRWQRSRAAAAMPCSASNLAAHVQLLPCAAPTDSSCCFTTSQAASCCPFMQQCLSLRG